MATMADVPALCSLGIACWQQYQQQLLPEYWQQLKESVYNEQTYIDLLNTTQCIVCTTNDGALIGMSYLIPKGNPTDIYDKDWCYIRFVSVAPEYAGKGIGRELTERSIALARENGEDIIALHTSEMMGNARHIYETLGFRILKEITPRLGKRYWLYTMQL